MTTLPKEPLEETNNKGFPVGGEKLYIMGIVPHDVRDVFLRLLYDS